MLASQTKVDPTKEQPKHHMVILPWGGNLKKKKLESDLKKSIVEILSFAN
jgi:hypothetical protein